MTTQKKKLSLAGVVLATFLVTAEAEHSAYPDLDDFSYVNYASQQEQVVYDYVDYTDHSNYEDDNRYRVDEQTKDYDYSRSDYKVVQEGTEGTYRESGSWSYDYNSDSYGFYYDSYWRPREEVHHHHYHYGESNNGRRDKHKDQRSDSIFSNGFCLFATLVLALIAFIIINEYYKEQQRKVRGRENEGKVKKLIIAPDRMLDTAEPVFF